MTGAAEENPAGSQAAAQPAPEQSAAPGTGISCSPGPAGWLASPGLSLAFSSYQSGQLFLAGRRRNGQVSFHQHGYGRAMGLWANAERVYLATSSQIWRLENVLRPDELANDRFDRLYVPRNAQTVGGLIVDLADGDRILTDGLSMPHSPRAWRGQLYVLDSGRGKATITDPPGRAEEIKPSANIECLVPNPGRSVAPWLSRRPMFWGRASGAKTAR